MNTSVETAAAAAANVAPTKTALFITGAWMHTSSWD